ncbi:MAG: aminoglycoside phosphotransferase family protein [Chloroflexaceae bacterium]|nr:aminoglycoside phosphotransferase family protein [Chloroflexaceae bacterium]
MKYQTANQTIPYHYLNVVIPPGNRSYSPAWQRVLAQLGSYTAQVVQKLRLRPTTVVLLAQTSTHLLVRISTANQHVVLVLAPELHLAGEVAFSRAMAAHNLPAPRLVEYDLSRTLIPCDYLIEYYVGGHSAEQLVQPYLLRGLARQTGRVLQRMHRIGMPGWARPNQVGRWLEPDWLPILTNLHHRLAPMPIARLVFGDNDSDMLASVLEQPILADVQPRLMHGNISPRAVRCTVNEAARLEAITDPGPLIGGDGMLDLARGLDPVYPDAWRAGLLEGYSSAVMPGPNEMERLRYLRILTCTWSACQRYIRAESPQAARDEALALFHGNIHPFQVESESITSGG